jgi:anthranilate/para-aminobenzoate synthase component I
MPKIKQINQKISWQNPLEIAHQVSISDYKEDWIFLYSGLHKNIKNSKSYICLFPQEKIIADDFIKLEEALKNNDDKYFGYLSYNLKNHLENLPNDEDSFINLPGLWVVKFGLVIEFNHDKKTAFYHKLPDFVIPNIEFLENLLSRNSLPRIQNGNDNMVASVQSNFTKSDYLKKVQQIKNHTQNGDIYQANLKLGSQSNYCQ